MTIRKQKNGGALTLALEGRLDTTTAPALEAVLKEELDEADCLIFDFSAIDCISSAGLRVLLSAQKTMSGKGSMKLTGVSDNIMEIFAVTGFTDILMIE